jgi:hypothetical protein
MPKYVMSDGRFTTSYQPACEFNLSIQKKYNVGSSHDYRYFLQKNAEKLIKELHVSNPDCMICEECEKALQYKP